MSADDDDFKRLEPKFLALARIIYDAGAKAALHRAMAGIQASMEDGSLRAPRPRRSVEYGTLIAPVRDALVKLAAESVEGVGAREIAEHFERAGGGPDAGQIRSVLKNLTNAGAAVRASRGHYLPHASELTKN